MGDSENFERLDRLVRTLVERFRSLQGENASLRGRLEKSEMRSRDLDEQLLALNQTRHDAAKRIDDLIAQLDHLDARLSRAADSAAE